MLIEQPLLRALAIVFLTSAMLSLGLQTTRGEIQEVMQDRRLVGRALLANLVIVPALGLLIAFFAPLAREVKLALALLALAPGAPFGLQFMRKVKDSAAVAVGLALLLAVVSLVYTPVMAAVLLPLEAPVRLPYGRIVAALLLYLALPLAAGLALHRRLPGLSARLGKPLFLLATVAFVTLMILSGELKRQGLAQIDGIGIAAMLASIAGAMLIGWWLGGPSPGDRQVLAVGSSMRNVVISHLIAASAFPDGNVDVVVMAFFALMVPANLLLTLGIAGYGKWQARHAPGPTEQPA
jgi:BASS family bile acid:Na+ symporter